MNRVSWVGARWVALGLVGAGGVLSGLFRTGWVVLGLAGLGWGQGWTELGLGWVGLGLVAVRLLFNIKPANWNTGEQQYRILDIKTHKPT